MSAQLPAGWQYGSTLRVKKRRRDRIQFETVSLAELIDSPVDAGAHHRQMQTVRDGGVARQVDLSMVGAWKTAYSPGGGIYLLPSGNLLVLAWEVKPQQPAWFDHATRE